MRMGGSQILAHCEDGLLLDTFNDTTNKIICDAYTVRNGMLLYHDKESVTFYDLKKNQKLGIHNLKDIKQIQLSECGCYGAVLTYSKELFLINTSSILYKASNVDKYKVSSSFIIYMVKGTLIIKKHGEYEESDSQRVISNVMEFELFDDVLIYSTKKSADSQKIFIMKNREQIFEFEFKKIERIEVKAEEKDKHLLILVTTEYVSNNYFGNSTLYFFNMNDKKFYEVAHSNPITYFTFKKGGFAICHGKQPSSVTLFDYSCVPMGEYPKGIRNRIFFNPHNNLVVFGGFDNLSGDIEVFDTQSLKLITKFKVLGASIINWSPCGVYFSVSITNFLKVDNKVTVYDYYGRIVKEKEFENLRSSTWIGDAKEFKYLEKPEKLNIEVETGYVPPSLRGQKEKKYFFKKNIKQADKQKEKVVKPLNKSVKVETKEEKSENKEEILQKLEEIKNLKEKLVNGEKLKLADLNKILGEELWNKKLSELEKK